MTDKKQIYEANELDTMFDTAFLPKLVEFCKRINESHPDNSFIGYQAVFVANITDFERPATYESMKDHLELKITPFEAKVEENEPQEEQSDVQKDS